MTSVDRLIAASRPDPAEHPGPLDTAFYDLVEARFRRVVADDPVTATFYGIHDTDDQLGDGSRDAVLKRIAAERAHLAAVVAWRAPVCRARLRSSAISSSTTSGGPSSIWTSCACGNAAPWRSTSWATGCS